MGGTKKRKKRAELRSVLISVANKERKNMAASKDVLKDAPRPSSSMFRGGGGLSCLDGFNHLLMWQGQKAKQPCNMIRAIRRRSDNMSQFVCSQSPTSSYCLGGLTTTSPLISFLNIQVGRQKTANIFSFGELIANFCLEGINQWEKLVYRDNSGTHAALNM